MQKQAALALTPDVTRYLQTVFLPLADDLLRRVQGCAIVLRDLDRSVLAAPAMDHLEIVVVLIGDIERSAIGFRKLCGLAAAASVPTA